MDEKAKAILRTRAIALAKAPRIEEETRARLEVLEFVLAYERYAIETSYIEEVYPLRELTPVPCTPPFVLGIINLRGQILSVIDLKKFFDLPDKGLTDLNKVIVLRKDGMHVGVLADQLAETRTISMDQIQQSAPTLAGIRFDYLLGVTAERLVVLDAAKILSDDRIVVHENVET